jgi:hypothetical protein
MAAILAGAGYPVWLAVSVWVVGRCQISAKLEHGKAKTERPQNRVDDTKMTICHVEDDKFDPQKARR